MTRKHFKAIADALRASKPDPAKFNNSGDGTMARAYWVVTCDNVANALAEFNPGFDHVRFLDACERA